MRAPPLLHPTTHKPLALRHWGRAVSGGRAGGGGSSDISKKPTAFAPQNLKRYARAITTNSETRVGNICRVARWGFCRVHVSSTPHHPRRIDTGARFIICKCADRRRVFVALLLLAVYSRRCRRHCYYRRRCVNISIIEQSPERPPSKEHNNIIIERD